MANEVDIGNYCKYMNMKKLVSLLMVAVMLLPAGCSKHSGKSKKADV